VIERRTFVVTVAFACVATPSSDDAQQADKVRRIGFLSAPSRFPEIEGFREGLREHGYVEGRNLLIDWQFADGRDERLLGLASELVTRKVEVIVTFASSAALAAKKATTTLPIVFAAVSEPVALGLVATLPRPGGNVTGFTNIATDLTGKRLELFKEADPSLKSVVILTDPANPASALTLEEAQVAARRLGLKARLLEVHHPSELEPAFAAIAREVGAGVVLVPGPFLFAQRLQIGALATRRRLPVLGWVRAVAESGALISYGASFPDMLRRVAGYVDKILKGAKPADLPVEQPTKFEFVINLKTAKTLGLTIPQTLLLRADEVIR